MLTPREAGCHGPLAGWRCGRGGRHRDACTTACRRGAVAWNETPVAPGDRSLRECHVSVRWHRQRCWGGKQKCRQFSVRKFQRIRLEVPSGLRNTVVGRQGNGSQRRPCPKCQNLSGHGTRRNWGGSGIKHAGQLASEQGQDLAAVGGGGSSQEPGVWAPLEAGRVQGTGRPGASGRSRAGQQPGVAW